MNGKITWFEILGSDAAALRDFYSRLFGWQLSLLPEGPPHYHASDCDQTGVPGGVGQAPAGPGWTTFYVEVPDVAAAVAQAVEMGGAVRLPPTELPDAVIAVVSDPEGHPVGLAHTRAA